MRELVNFKQAFKALTENVPFPWQESMYERMVNGEWKVLATCSLPTGLGKTCVIPIWLIALANKGDRVPRRLVYVVNRRTVVDQATRETETIRTRLQTADRNILRGLVERLSKLTTNSTAGPLAISTLRGQFADNAEWRGNPARPAVIVGTVDMIGSRLLFGGYGVGFKGKPLHAGFLGQDVLLVHDEAHLEPAFQELLVRIRKEQSEGRTPDLRPIHVMALSATSRGDGREFGLTNEDKKHRIVKKRIEAKKRLILHTIDDENKTADRAADLALTHKDSGQAVLVFLRKVEDVEKVVARLRKDKQQVAQLTGTLRGLERDRLASEDPIFGRFLPKPATPPREGTVYLVCTSAGEVGVNMSADHLVCDLTPFDSMAQRFGRINRFGDGDARIDVVSPAKFEEDRYDTSRQRTLSLLRRLKRDASPAALADLPAKTRIAAFTPQPEILPTSDILFDAWALTTIRDKVPGRPPVAPYLHGLAEWQPFETHVAWREEVEVLESEELRERYKPIDLLEDYPLKPHELLREATDRKGSGVFAQLTKIAARHPDAPVWIIDSRDQVNPMTLQAMVNAGNAALHDATVLLPPHVGGLSKSGTLDGDASHDDALQYDVADEWYEDKERTIKRRIRFRGESRDPVRARDMRWVRTIDTDPAADEMDAAESVPNRFWHWYTRPRSADDDLSKSSTKPVEWGIHIGDTVRQIDRILAGLSLPEELAQAVRVAVKLHDHGKRRPQFQFALGNRAYPELVLAKSDRTGAKLPETYRHEFGSLVDAVDDAEFQQLSPEMQDVVLHLIAAHHGRARPHFPIDEAFDSVPGRTLPDANQLASDVPRRFARLQRKYGRWGLAYLESLLRAADWAASAEPSEFVTETKEASR